MKTTANDTTLKPRIAHVCTSDLSIKYLLKNQLRKLDSLGYEVYALSGKGAFYNELKEESFHYECLPIYRRIVPPLDLYSLARVAAQLRSLDLDLVHTHTNKAGILGCWAAHLAGVKNIVSTVHGFYFHEHMNPPLKRFFVDLYRITFKLTKRIFLQSAEDVETAIRLKIAPREKLIHIGNGIDLERFNPQRSELSEEARFLRLTNNIPVDTPLVGAIARLNHEKGVKELLWAAYDLIKQERLKVHFVIIGEGPAEGEFRSLVNTLGISANVHFTGFQENIPAWLTALDIFALPSYREGLPRSICEAFAMGTPVIATNIRGCRELVKDRETGLLVPRKDSEALAEAIKELISNSGLRERIKAQAAEYAEKYLDENRIVGIIHRTYMELGLKSLEPGHDEKAPAGERTRERTRVVPTHH
jgi:glycosyltransferase involved in cell wall biosynthesis